VCTNGQVKCVSGELSKRQVCTGGQWVTQDCPAYNICNDSQCRAVCDGNLSSSTKPRVCVFPLVEGTFNGTYFWSNNTSKLPVSALDAAVWDGSVDNPVYTDSSLPWPNHWSLSYPSDVATVVFKLQYFSFPVQEVRLYYRARRAGIISNITNYLIAFSNASTTIGSATQSASYSWQVNNVFAGYPYNQQFSYGSTQWNAASLAVTGDGFGSYPDLIDLNWYMLEVTQ
jgi:hypothetical protein